MEKYNGPTEFVHLHNHTIYSTLDGVSTPEQYADQCAKRGYRAMAVTEHGHMGSVPDLYFAFKKKGLKYIPGCFLPSQPILTLNGVKAISDLKSPESAFTHQSDFCHIQNIQIRQYSGPMVRIKAWCVEDQLSTPEHPFLVREVVRREVSRGVWSEDISVGWREAKELRREKYTRTYSTERSKDRSNKRRYRFYLCVPRLPTKSSIQSISLAEYAFKSDSTLNVVDGVIETVTYARHGYRTTKPVRLPAAIQLDDNLLWIIGLWLAEGSEKNGLEFSLCADEMHFYERIADYFAQFDIKTSFNLRNDSYALDVHVYSTFFGRLFRSLFGHGHDQKRLPMTWLSRLGGEQASAILEGLLDGDAKRSPQVSYLKLNNETLIWQVRLLMTKLDVPQYSAITKLPCNNSDSTSYSIHFRESGHFYYDYDADYLYLPIYDIANENYDGEVYNIQVARDNSYFTGVAVHNCEIYFNDYEPERQVLTKPLNQIKVEDPDYHKRLVKNRHLTVLAKNEVGYSNLIKLTTQAYKTGLYYKPRIWFDKLCEFKEGLIILSGCLNGPIAYELRQEEPRYNSKDKRGAADWAKKFKAVFKDDYWMELQMPGVDGDVDVFKRSIELADTYGINIALANDSHYMVKADYELQVIMMAISQGMTVDNPELFFSNASEQYFKTRAELWDRFATAGYHDGIDAAVFEKACDNTIEIAERCENLKVNAEPKTPTFENADDELAKLAITQLCKRKLNKITKRYPVDGRDVTYFEQLQIELERIAEKGFSSYFLITHNIIQYGKEKGWPFSPRGSAGGALICLLLGISTIDPLKWGLSFDRFLSPSRGGFMLDVTMPVDKPK